MKNAPDVCDGTSAAGESWRRVPRRASVDQPTESLLKQTARRRLA